MITREQQLKNDLREEIKKHSNQVEFYREHIKRNKHAMEFHTCRVKEAQDILYKLEGFKWTWILVITTH